MRLGALIISARGGYQIPPPLSNRVNSMPKGDKSNKCANGIGCNRKI